MRYNIDENQATLQKAWKMLSSVAHNCACDTNRGNFGEFGLERTGFHVNFKYFYLMHDLVGAHVYVF